MRGKFLTLIFTAIFLATTACIQVRTVTTRTVEFDLPWSTSEPVLDPTPTIGIEPEPTITPTWSSCQEENFNVRVTVSRLNVRRQTITNTQNPLNQAVIGSVLQNALLEVDSCLLEVTPGGWFPIHTDDGLQGIVSSEFTRVTQN